MARKEQVTDGFHFTLIEWAYNFYRLNNIQTAQPILGIEPFRNRNQAVSLARGDAKPFQAKAKPFYL